MVTADGRVVLWGAAGLVDDGEVPATLSTVVVQVSVGDGFVLALTRDGRVVGHGDNTQGQVSVPGAVQGPCRHGGGRVRR